MTLPSWSYDSWIDNYLCNQYLSPLMLSVRIRSRRGVFDTLCGKLFSPCTPVSPPIKLKTRYNWNIVESGVKHHNPACYCTVHAYVVFQFFVIVCCPFEWKRICASFIVGLYIWVVVGDPVIDREGLRSHLAAEP